MWRSHAFFVAPISRKGTVMATATTKQDAKQAVIKEIPLGSLVPTKENRRGRITNESVQSLADSIRANGVLQPIVVRPHPQQKGKFEIRAGERRFRAAKRAGLKTIPAVVRELDDNAARAVTVVENLQRQNLSPIEEALAIQAAIEAGENLETVADRLGLSAKQAARRAALRNLSKTWQDALADATSFVQGLSLGHLEVIARLPHELQDEIADDDFEAILRYDALPTVAELTQMIDGVLHTVAAMSWSTTDETLVPKAGACTDCRKRSDKHPMLFDDAPLGKRGTVSNTARCLDPHCYQQKEAAHVEQRVNHIKVKHPTLQLVAINGVISDAARETFGDDVKALYNARFVAKATKATIPVMPVSGERAGKVLYVEREDRGSYSEAAKSAKGKKKPLTLAERKQKLTLRRQAFVVKKAREALRELDDAAIESFAKELAKPPTAAARKFDGLALLLFLGTKSKADSPAECGDWSDYDNLARSGIELQRTQQVLTEATPMLLSRLRDWGSTHVDNQYREVQQIARFFQWDLETWEAEAIKAIPTPKSWAHLKADGTPRK